jgi:hypothetical protein
MCFSKAFVIGFTAENEMLNKAIVCFTIFGKENGNRNFAPAKILFGILILFRMF